MFCFVFFSLKGPEADAEIGSPTRMAEFSEKMQQAKKELPWTSLNKEVSSLYMINKV
jgi:hypothetical protein